MNCATLDQKKVFVTGRLLPMLKDMDSDIIDVNYEIMPFSEDYEEFVTITFRSTVKRKLIYVTADSLSALTKDVLNALF